MKTDDSPLHYNKKALPALVEVLIDVNNSDDMGTRGSSPMQLHLSSRFGTVMKHLQEWMKRRTSMDSYYSKLKLI